MLIVRPGSGCRWTASSAKATHDRRVEITGTIPWNAARDLLLGGTVNQNGVVHVEATAVGGDTALQRSRGWSRPGVKAPIQKLVDRVAAVPAPVVM
jgi:cation transport ATPase